MYTTAKPIISFLLNRFFQRIDIQGCKLRETGPVLITSNHPNMMLDALLIYTLYQRPLWFLAKSTLFCNPLIARFLTAAHLLPVYRPSDGQDTQKNKDTFAAAIKHLLLGDGIAIFPEGTSLAVRRILALKTGAARLALQAESESQGALNLYIQPVGITYSDPVKFRSTVTLNVGDPISLQPFLEQYQEDQQGTVRSLTAKIEIALSNLTVQVPNDDLMPLVQKIKRLYGEAPDDLERLRRIALNVSAIAPLYPELAQAYEDRIDAALDGSTIPANSLPSSISWSWPLMLPFVTLGILIHLAPYKVVGYLACRSAPEDVYLASNKLVFGVLVYPLWYLIGLLVLATTTSLSLTFGVLLLALCCGVLAERYQEQWRATILSWAFPEQAILRRAERELLIEELEQLRVDNQALPADNTPS